MMLFGVLLGLGTISAPFANQADPRITLTVPATNAKSALNFLGSAAHVTLLTSPQTANDILTFRFVDVPFSEALRRIADVEDAEWKIDNGIKRLVRTTKLQQAESESETKRKIRAFSLAISQRSAEFKKQEPWSDREADGLAEQIKTLTKSAPQGNPPKSWRTRAEQLVNQGPISRAIHKIVSAMDPVELAGLSESLRTVWSSRPTKTQLPLSPKIAGIIEQYVQDQAVWVQAVNSHSLLAPEIKDNPYWTQQLGDLLNHENQPIATVLLTAEPQNDFNFDLTTYNDRGKLIAHAAESLEGIYPKDAESLKALFPNPGEKPILLEGDDRLVIDYERKGQLAARGAPPPELLNKLIDPDHFDPLSLCVSPVLIQVAKVRGVNMVARLPDDAYQVGDLVLGPEGDCQKVFRNLNLGGCLLDCKEGWITVRPDRPATSRTIQSDRIALAKFMGRSNSHKPLSIDEQVEYKTPLPPNDLNILPWSEAILLNCPETEFFDTPILRFYAEATPQQKDRMSMDGMSLSNLTVNEHRIVDEMVYGSNGFQLVFTPIAASDGSPETDPELYSSGILSEPTEALPNGIPPDGIVKMRVENASCVYLDSTASNARGVNDLSADRLALLKYIQDHPEDQRPGSRLLRTDLNHFIAGRRMRITFTFQFTATLSMTGSIDDGNVTDLKPVSFDDLPKDFKAEFDMAYQKWAKMMSMRQAGTRGKIVPPL